MLIPRRSAPAFAALLVVGATLVPTAAAQGAAPRDTASTSPLVAEWHMDELDPNSDGPSSTPDTSDNGSPLAIEGATQVPGRFGQAFSFDASHPDSMITLGQNPQLHPTRITTMAWVKGSSSPGTYKDVLSQGGDTDCGVASYALYTGANGGLSFYIATNRTTTINSVSATPATVWDGQWHAVAGVYDGTTVRLYVDGTEVGAPTAASSSSIDYSLDDDTFSVGSFHACSGFAFTGGVDEVRVYDRGLSSAEVAEIQGGSPSTPPELGHDATTTHVVCDTTTLTVGSTTTCTAMVSDTASAPEGAPTGHVAFTSDGAGTFSTTSCTLGSPQGTTSTCSATYVPSAIGSGTHHVTTAYTSDAADLSSNATATLSVVAGAPTPAPPAPAPPTATFTAPATTAPATPLTFDAGATTGASTLLWGIPGQGTVSCSAQTPTLTVHLATPGTVKLTAFGAGGSSTATHIVGLTAGALLPPKGAATYLSTAVCSGGSPTADTTANGGPPAGCTTQVTAGIVSATGCLTQVTDPAQVPSGEASILDAMLSTYQATPALQLLGGYYCRNIASCSTRTITLPGFGHLKASDPVVQTLGLYVSSRPVRINGIDFTPVGGATIAVSPGFARVVSSNALVRVGGVPIKAGAINLDVSSSCNLGCGHTVQPIASFDSKGLPGIGGDDFPFTGTADISFVLDGGERYSEIHGHIELPPSLGGISVDGHLRVDSANGITPEDFHAHLDGLGYDDIGLTNVDVYFQAPDDWAFFGDLGIGTAEIRLTPLLPDEPYNGIVFHKGTLDHAGATLDLTRDPPEIAPGVQLEKLSLSFALNPTALRGSVTLNALAVADVTGNVVLAFPSASAPFKVGPTDLPGAPAKILGQTYTSGPVFGVGGKVAVVIPDLGTVPLGAGYLLYDAPGYIAAGGEISTGIADVLTVSGRVDGELNVINRRFNLSGSVQGCISDVCGSVDAVVSSYGAGICAGDFGGGVRWDDFPDPHLYGKVLGIGVGCTPSKFTDDHVFDGHLAAADVSGARTFVVKKGQPLPEVRLDGGSAGAPNVSVTGPDGQVLTADGLGVHRGGGMIAIQSERLSQTTVGVEPTAKPGTYTITPLAGPAVVGSAHATEGQAASAKATVTGTGTHRVLHFDVARRDGETITFLEVSHGVSREIGITTGGKGTIRFTTSPGHERRTIIAADARYGIAVPGAQAMTVAHFTGPAFVKPASVKGLTTRWSGGKLKVSWKAAADAATYQVTVLQKGGGVLKLTTRKHSLSIGAQSTLKGSVSVVAVSADGSKGRSLSRSYKAAKAAVDRFLPFKELKAKPAKKKVSSRAQ